MGDGTDTLAVNMNGDAGNVNVSGAETFALTTSSNSDAMDFRNVTDLKTISVAAGGGSQEITLDRIQTGVSVVIASSNTLAAADLDLDGGTSLDLSLGKDAATASAEGTAANVTALTVDSSVKTLNLTVNGAKGSSSSGSDKNIIAGTLSAAGATALSVDASNGEGNFTITTLTAGKLESLKVSGSGTGDYDFGAIAGTSDLATIDASGSNANIDLSGLDEMKDGASVTLGSGDDSITWDGVKASSAVIAGGSEDSAGDTLYIKGTQNVGQTLIDLSSSSDQVTKVNGEGNSAAQTQFENVDVSGLTGFGATIKGSDGNNIITGSALIDVVAGGKGADTVDLGGGLDTYEVDAGDTVLTIGGSGNAGTISGFDSITGLAAATASALSETLDVAGTAAVVANTAGTNGDDSTLTISGNAVRSHDITDGIIRFDDNDTFAGASVLTISDAAGVAAAVQYLQLQDFGDTGATVAFRSGADTYVFTQGSDSGDDDSLDTLVKLTGVAATKLVTTNAANANELFIA